MKRKLAKAFKEFKKLPFPKDAIGKLGDVFVELVDLDGYIAGLISSFLQNIDIKQWEIVVDENMNKKLRSYIPKNVEEKIILQELIVYKKKLDELTKLLVNCLSS